MLGMYSGACASSLVGGVRLLCTERRFDPASTAPAGVVLGSVARLDASSRGNPCSCSVREQTTAAPPGVAYLVGGVVLELLHCSLPRCAGEVRAKALRRPRLWAWLPFLKALQGSLLFAFGPWRVELAVHGFIRQRGSWPRSAAILVLLAYLLAAQAWQKSDGDGSGIVASFVLLVHSRLIGPLRRRGRLPTWRWC